MSGEEEGGEERRLQKEETDPKEEGTPYLQWDVMSLEKLEEAMGKSEDEQQILMSELLGLTDYHVSMKESALLHYYLQGLNWSRDAHFSPLQTSFTMALLHVLLHNITDKDMGFVNNAQEFAQSLAAACHSAPLAAQTSPPLLSAEEAEKLIRFIIESLFQKYQLFRALGSRRDELLLGSQETVELLLIQDAIEALEEDISTAQVSSEEMNPQLRVSEDDTA